MKRRFGRRRRGGGEGNDGGPAAIDPGWLARIVEAGLVPVESLEPVTDDAVPSGLALLGAGVDAEGRSVLVAFSTRDAGDALLGLVAHRRRAAPEAAEPGPGDAGAEPGAEGAPRPPHRAYVVSRWSAAARRRLAFVGELDVRVEPVEAGRLLEGPDVLPEPAPRARALPAFQVGAGLADPAARELFDRALESLAGLAAKHAGGVRGTDAGAELVLMARRVARLLVRDEAVQLEAFEGRTSPQTLSPANLAEVFDQLEGQLRKRLRDNRILRGEEGLRTRAQLGLASSVGLRTLLPFPLGGSDGEVIDAVGVDGDGRIVVVAVRERLGLDAVGPILDAWAALQPSLPGLLTDARPPVRLGAPPRLVVAAASWDPTAVRVLEGLTLELERLDVRAGRDGLPDLVPAGSAPASAPAVGGRERPGRRRGRGRRGPRRGRGGGGGEGGSGRDDAGADEAADGPDDVREASDGDDGRAEARADEREREEADERPRYAELSSFDLDDSFGLESEKSGGGRGRGRGRRRGRGRGRRREGDDGGDEGDEADAEPEPARAPAEARSDDASPAEPESSEEEDLGMDDEELELAEAPEPDDEPEPVRQERPRRAAILAHADRHSLAAAMLLAREARQVEGIWVYPQEELMTFFRSVTTDLRDDVTIIVVGFQAKPARDVLQAASLYAGRLEWYDTREWPPEVRAQFVDTLGTDFVDVRPGLDTPMPLVLPRCSRRSRFSDKLVDLASARFTEHDFQRWGRLWWWRLADIASRPGEHKNELQSLLTGRPSDLAAEAERAEMPPPPPEVAYVGGRDFRIVHFGGYALVVVDVPETYERSMAGRIARERYGAQLSLAHHPGDGLMILGTSDGPSGRPLAVGAMAQHLGEKLAWVETLPGDDHVARFRIHDLDAHPERLETVVGEIGMGRSILEG